MGSADMGVTNYGRMPRLCSASIFFKDTAGDMFRRLKEEIETRKMGEEEGIMRLRLDDVYKERVKPLNLTYAFHKFNLWHCFCRADKPVRAVHFHLTPDKYDFFVNGNNSMGLNLIPHRLIKIFNKNGFKE